MSYGGHLINATGLRLQYRTVTHQSLRAEVVLTGQAEGRSLMNYLVGAGPVIPDPAIMWDPTPAERAVIDEAVSAYYRIGDSIDWTVTSHRWLPAAKSEQRHRRIGDGHECA